MSDHNEKKVIIPTEALRREGNTINQSAQQIDPAGRHRVNVNANAQGDQNTKQPGELPSDAKEDAEDKQVRDAGTKEMRNPPRTWTLEDEESDESFPASDPPGNY